MFCKTPSLFSSSRRCRNVGLSESECGHYACPSPIPLLLWFGQRVSPWLLTGTSTSFCCWIFRANHRILWWRWWRSSWSCSWGRTRWLTRNHEQYRVRYTANSSLALFGEMWFLTAGPVVGVPMILAELPERKNFGCFFRHEEVQSFQIFSGLFFGSHLAVGRHHRRRIPRYPHGLHLDRVKVFLADHMHTSAGIHHKLSLSSGSFIYVTGNTHSSEDE